MQSLVTLQELLLLVLNVICIEVTCLNKLVSSLGDAISTILDIKMCNDKTNCSNSYSKFFFLLAKNAVKLVKTQHLFHASISRKAKKLSQDMKYQTREEGKNSKEIG